MLVLISVHASLRLAVQDFLRGAEIKTRSLQEGQRCDDQLPNLDADTCGDLSSQCTSKDLEGKAPNISTGPNRNPLLRNPIL